MNMQTTTETTKTLEMQLAELKESFKQRAAPGRVALMEAATTLLRASGIEQRALGTGDFVPDVTLPNALGQSVRLRDLWQRGPLVIIFYRGGWCPYCNLELRAWQQHLAALSTRGASLVAVSPQTPDNSMTTAEKNTLAYPVLSDSSLVAAEAFRIAFTLPPDLVELYTTFGNDLPTLNGNGKWVLPLPATYVVDTDGRVVFAHVNADYRERAEPADVLSVVAKIAALQ
jgi:peroxiredoxin